MTRRLARIALVAALMVGVIAMHSFGHRGHTESGSETVPGALADGQAVAAAGAGGAPEDAVHANAGAGAVVEVEPLAQAMHHHMAHGSAGHHAAPKQDPGQEADQEEDPLGALSMLGFMICGAVLLRVAFEVLRLVWPRLLASLAALPAAPAFRALSTRLGPPPPRLRPTSLLLNRIAVQRI